MNGLNLGTSILMVARFCSSVSVWCPCLWTIEINAIERTEHWTLCMLNRVQFEFHLCGIGIESCVFCSIRQLFFTILATMGMYHILFTFASSDRENTPQRDRVGKRQTCKCEIDMLRYNFTSRTPSRLNMHCHQIDWWLSPFWLLPTKPNQTKWNANICFRSCHRNTHQTSFNYWQIFIFIANLWWSSAARI